jgi:hypothetical protein
MAMNDDMLAYLRDNPEGVPSTALAEHFLKFQSPVEHLAHVAVTAILSKDRRCRLGDDGLWHAVAPVRIESATALDDTPWAAVSAVHHGRELLHVSVWNVLPQPKLLAATWLVDPEGLSPDDQQRLRGPGDTPYNEEQREELLSALANGLADRVPVFMASREQSLLEWHCAPTGIFLGDDTMRLSQFFRAAGSAVPRPLDIESCYHELFGRRPLAVGATQRGRLLAECVAELVERLRHAGVETRNQFEAQLVREVEEFDFSGKHFDSQTLAELRTGPGVYGFKDSSGQFIYIGKAANIRRRVSSYFSKTDESPAKLERLRREAEELIIHPCGSELESLIYEYRLIDKYSPRLNTQAQISERKGTYRPLDDCVVLLPHADEGMGMSVWVRRGQKVALRAFDINFHNSEDLVEELDSFFFTPELEATSSDFPEQEIATRWLSRRLDSLPVVAAYRMASGQEILGAMRAMWEETEVPRP